ncbi:MAG: glycosyltransferase family 2 protein [Alphaproteobacteria bacterium]|nr:glycosyltransferase family 2 protein [Alphaproteobacteria bacterium]
MLRLGPPRLSFVIPAWNQERFLAASVGSALSQTIHDIEVVVVDDASTDATPHILAAIDDPRLVALRSEKNLGPGGARNLGLEAAQAPIIAFLDADDVAAPERAERQLAFFATHPDHVLLGSAYGVIDEQDHVLRIERPFETEDTALRFTSLFLSPVHLTTSAIRADVARAQNVAFPTDGRIVEDYRFVSALIRYGEVANLADVLTYYRRHEAMTSRLFEREGWQGFAEASAANISALGVDCDASLAARLAQVHLAKLSGAAVPEGETLVEQLYETLKQLFEAAKSLKNE